jgi:hypothetical protein
MSYTRALSQTDLAFLEFDENPVDDSYDEPGHDEYRDRGDQISNMPCLQLLHMHPAYSFYTHAPCLQILHKCALLTAFTRSTQLLGIHLGPRSHRFFDPLQRTARRRKSRRRRTPCDSGRRGAGPWGNRSYC